MSGLEFQNPIVGGTNLIRAAIQSPDYQPGVSGWTINRDGTAEFNGVEIRGTVTIGDVADNQYVSLAEAVPAPLASFTPIEQPNITYAGKATIVYFLGSQQHFYFEGVFTDNATPVNTVFLNGVYFAGLGVYVYSRFDASNPGNVLNFADFQQNQYGIDASDSPTGIGNIFRTDTLHAFGTDVSVEQDVIQSASSYKDTFTVTNSGSTVTQYRQNHGDLCFILYGATSGSVPLPIGTEVIVTGGSSKMYTMEPNTYYKIDFSLPVGASANNTDCYGRIMIRFGPTGTTSDPSIFNTGGFPVFLGAGGHQPEFFSGYFYTGTTNLTGQFTMTLAVAHGTETLTWLGTGSAGTPGELNAFIKVTQQSYTTF